MLNKIVCVYDIKLKELQKPIQLINCLDKEKNKKYLIKEKENEDELTANCTLFLNDEEIKFTLQKKLTKKGKNTMIIECERLLINISWFFYNCTTLINLDLSNFNTEKVTNMAYMFNNCRNLENLGSSTFKTNAQNMEYMFNNCNKITSLTISNFGTTELTNMAHMFDSCENLNQLYLSGLNTGAVKNMEYTFNNCKSITNLNLNNFDTSSVTTMDHMFSDCNKMTTLTLDTGKFNTQNIKNMIHCCYR